MCRSSFVVIFPAENVTIMQLNEHCCGQKQMVMCNATEATLIKVVIGDINALFRSIDEGTVVERDGFTIHLVDAVPHPDISFVSQFIVEVKFQADSDVNVTCSTLTASANITMTLNSKSQWHWQCCSTPTCPALLASFL